MLTSIDIIFDEGRIYLIIYACLAMAMIIELFYENEILAKWMARAGALTIILLIGLRWETGTDWFPYYKIFYTSDSSSDYESVVFGIDYGYIIFNKLVYLFSREYTVFLMIDAIVAVGAVYVFIERSTKLPCMGIFLFYASYGMTHFMGSNRRMIAIGFTCVGFLFLARPRRLSQGWPRWVVPFGLAALMHRTSVAALPGLIVSEKAWRAPTVIFILVMSLALGITGISFSLLEGLANALSQYAGLSVVSKLVFYTSGDAQYDANTDFARQAILGALKRGSVIAILVMYMKYAKPSPYVQKLYNIYIAGCAIYFSMIAAPIFQIISTYYSIVEIVLMPLVFYDLKSLKVPYTLYLLVFALALLLSSLTPYLELYVPYHSVYSVY
ncbi:EpsG family protein [Sphingomonas kyungheensis]|uniref:EpsG family protein n=1 Tax=Sphingomonas kyungheensis TaxID=1069987 RepID=A0ABU8H4K9_9SPHN